jgi:hypothetical protein
MYFMEYATNSLLDPRGFFAWLLLSMLSGVDESVLVEATEASLQVEVMLCRSSFIMVDDGFVFGVDWFKSL